ncbi:MAG: aminoglycoside phosphotransferase family protein [Chloroflexi bacterium]|nr:aminoglycoside phosphotransferase family protein [Chloroflexota bacterium]
MMAESSLLKNIRPPRIRPYIGRLWYDWLDGRRLARAVGLAPLVLTRVPPLPGASRLDEWVVQDARWSKTGAAVLHLGLGPPSGEPLGILKLAFTDTARQGLRAQSSLLAQLRSDSRLGDWHALLPRPVAEGEVAGLYYVLQEALPGLPADARPGGADVDSWRLLGLAIEAIRPLHQRTVERTILGGSFVAEAVDRPLALLRLAARSSLPIRREDSLARLARELHGVLAGREGVTGWIHGDLWLGNVLVAPEGSRVTGIVDWSAASPRELALHDVLHLILHRRQVEQKRELGAVVRAVLERAEWEPGERELLAQPLLAAGIGERAAVLLYWLRRLRFIIEQGTGPARNPLWVAWNIDEVLRCL